MKNIILGLFILFVSNINNLQAQDRNVVWVHGWGEPRDIWAFYDEQFSLVRQMNGSRTNTNIEYLDNNGIALAANDADGRITNSFATGNLGADPTRNIGIGHSLGGVVLRQIDRNENGLAAANKTINGIITVGSPNYGAGMADAALNGTIQNVLTDGCNRLAAGPLSSTVGILATINGFTREDLCDFLWDDVFDDLIPNAGPTLEDLRLTGDFMSNQTTGLNQFQSGLPRISIWGNENSPTHWRLASSFLTMETNINGGVNDDELVPTVIDQFRGDYNYRFIQHTSLAITFTGIGFLNPLAFAAVPYHTYRAVQWKKGRDWFDNSESIWNAMILCQGSYTLTYTIQNNPLHNYCNGYMFGSQQWWNCASWACGCPVGDYACLTSCTQPQTINQVVNVNHPSDGLVCSYSQILDDIDQNLNVYEAVGVNHRDETDTRDMQNQAGPNGQPQDVMRITFNEIWDRPAFDFFHTPE